ncbi:hypothetical protein OKW41_002500 [Paraburkholderia sp. UCT70]
MILELVAQAFVDKCWLCLQNLVDSGFLPRLEFARLLKWG